MELVKTISLMMVVAWASGINLYAVVLVLGVLGSSGYMVLPETMQVLTRPEIMTLAFFLYIVEFIADKVPAFDSLWDAVHTFIRIPAGAILAAAALGKVDPVILSMAIIAGGLLSASSHTMKMSSRIFINTSPEPFTNWTASIFEDIAVAVAIFTALNHPVIFLFLLALFIALVIWLIPKLFIAIKSIFLSIRGIFTKV